MSLESFDISVVSVANLGDVLVNESGQPLSRLHSVFHKETEGGITAKFPTSSEKPTNPRLVSYDGKKLSLDYPIEAGKVLVGVSYPNSSSAFDIYPKFRHLEKDITHTPLSRFGMNRLPISVIDDEKDIALFYGPMPMFGSISILGYDSTYNLEVDYNGKMYVSSVQEPRSFVSRFGIRRGAANLISGSNLLLAERVTIFDYSKEELELLDCVPTLKDS
jgi:hypothetical protein